MSKKTILLNKIYNLDYGNFSYPLTKQLIWNGRKNKILNKKINIKIPITLFYGLKDEVVPLKLSKKIFKIFTHGKKKLIKIKNGDHSLSKKNDIKKLCKELNNMITPISH